MFLYNADGFFQFVSPNVDLLESRVLSHAVCQCTQTLAVDLVAFHSKSERKKNIKIFITLKENIQYKVADLRFKFVVRGQQHFSKCTCTLVTDAVEAEVKDANVNVGAKHLGNLFAAVTSDAVARQHQLKLS